MSSNVWAQLALDVEKSWAGLVAAFGDAADPASPQLTLLWDRQGADIANPSAVARELADGCKKAWAVVVDIQAESNAGQQVDGKGSALSDRDQAMRERLAPKKASSQCLQAIGTVMRAGMFEAAIDGFLDAWLNAPHGGLWEPSEVMAFLCREASSSRSGWPDKLSAEQKLDLLIKLPCWTPTGNEWESDSRRGWQSPLAGLGRLAALRPALSERCAAIVKLSEPLWLTGVGDPENFGRELGEELGRMKIVGGALDSNFWEALPFSVRLGVALSVKAESKLGAWAIRRALSESLAADDATGHARRNLEDLCAALWCSFDRKAIDILESLAPAEHEGWTATGVKRRFTGGPNGSVIMQWHYAEHDWESEHAKWARKLGSVAGLKSPARDGNGGQSWMELVQALQALRQADALKKSLPKKPKSTAKKKGAGPRRGRI